MTPQTDPKTGRPLPFAQQPREFQLAETVKVVAGYVMCDRSGLTRDGQIDWYMTYGGPAEFDADAQAEIRAGVVARLAADA